MKEYWSAGIPMLPVKVGLSEASEVVFLLNVVTVAFSLLFPLFGLAKTIYLLIAISAGCAFLFQNRGLIVSASEEHEFKALLLPCLISHV